MRSLLVLASLALALAACGAESGPEPDREAAATPPPADTLYEANTTVLEAGRAGPKLCLGGVRLSLPPQCGDVSVAGWSWDAVAGEESIGGTTWGEFDVVGTFDRDTFALVEAGPVRPDVGPSADDASSEPPCPEPEGGWIVTNPETTTQEHVRLAEAYARREREYVASWVHHLQDPSELEAEEYEEDIPVVYVAIFTAAAERHEGALRERWEGPLCVVERELPSAREASRIRTQAEASLEELGLQMLWSDEGGLAEAATIGVVADPGARARRRSAPASAPASCASYPRFGRSASVRRGTVVAPLERPGVSPTVRRAGQPSSARAARSAGVLTFRRRSGSAGTTRAPSSAAAPRTARSPAAMRRSSTGSASRRYAPGSGPLSGCAARTPSAAAASSRR